MMAVLSKHAVVCLDAITDASQRQAVVDELTASCKQLLTITHEESEAMCANMFDILDKNGNHCLVLS